MAGTFGHQMGEGVGSTPRNSATARRCPAVDLSSGTTHLECRVPHNCWGRQHPRLAPVPGGWQAGAGESPTHRRHGSGAWWEPWRWSQGAGKSRLEVGLDRHRNCQGDGGKACRQRGQLHAFGAAGYQGAAQEGIKGVVSIRAARLRLVSAGASAAQRKPLWKGPGCSRTPPAVWPCSPSPLCRSAFPGRGGPAGQLRVLHTGFTDVNQASVPQAVPTVPSRRCRSAQGEPLLARSHRVGRGAMCQCHRDHLVLTYTSS